MLGEALLYWFKISLPFLSFFDSTAERSSRDSQMHSRKRIILLPSNPNKNLPFAIFLFMRWRSLSNKFVVYSTSKKSHHGRTWVICTKNASTTYTQAQQQCSSTGKKCSHRHRTPNWFILLFWHANRFFWVRRVLEVFQHKSERGKTKDAGFFGVNCQKPDKNP